MFGPRTIQSADISAKRLDIPKEEEEEVVCLVASYFRSKFGIRQRIYLKEKKGGIYKDIYICTAGLFSERETLISLFLFLSVYTSSSFSLCKFFPLISIGYSTFILGFKSKATS